MNPKKNSTTLFIFIFFGIFSAFFSLTAAEFSKEIKNDLINSIQFYPKEVALKKTVKLEAFTEGKKSGDLTLPIGREILIHELKGETITFRFASCTGFVSLADTNFFELVKANKEAWQKKSLIEKRAKLIATSPP